MGKRIKFIKEGWGACPPKPRGLFIVLVLGLLTLSYIGFGVWYWFFLATLIIVCEFLRTLFVWIFDLDKDVEDENKI